MKVKKVDNLDLDDLLHVDEVSNIIIILDKNTRGGWYNLRIFESFLGKAKFSERSIINYSEARHCDILI